MRDPRTPVTYHLPDGDAVQLMPWPWVIWRLQLNLTKTMHSMVRINNHLWSINNKLKDMTRQPYGDGTDPETTSPSLPPSN